MDIANYDKLDKEMPYKAIADVMVTGANGITEKKRRGVRFATQEEALSFFKGCIGLCLLSHRNYKMKSTKILKYKFQ